MAQRGTGSRGRFEWKLLIDMNLSPRWIEALADAGIEARHYLACLKDRHGVLSPEILSCRTDSVQSLVCHPSSRACPGAVAPDRATSGRGSVPVGRRRIRPAGAERRIQLGTTGLEPGRARPAGPGATFVPNSAADDRSRAARARARATLTPPLGPSVRPWNRENTSSSTWGGCISSVKGTDRSSASSSAGLDEARIHAGARAARKRAVRPHGLGRHHEGANA